MDGDVNESARLHRRARERRANWLVYGPVRVSFQAFFLVYFRMRRIGREHVPKRGPVIIASNHRSFLDPWVIACMARRPMYYVTKKEIFAFNRVLAWLLSALGAFPVDRGAGDAQFIETAKSILARGDIVLIFPEGTRTRPGPLGRPKRGVGRLALETGVPVVPLAVLGTEAVRRGWRIRPRKVSLRAGRALHFPQVAEPSIALAGAVTDRIWPCVMLQWEWLGGLPPARRATVIGTGEWATSLAACLRRAGLEVTAVGAAVEQKPLGQPGTGPRPGIRAGATNALSREGCDLVCLAVRAAELPAVMAAHGDAIPTSAGVLVVSQGVVPPLGTVPAAFVAERCAARAVAALGGSADAAGVLAPGGEVVVASLDRAFARQLADLLGDAGLTVQRSSDLAGASAPPAQERARRVAARSG